MWHVPISFKPISFKFAVLSALAYAATPVLAAADQPVSEARMHQDVENLVAFGTRHTLSSQDDPRRGISAAPRWAEAELRRIGKSCDNCLEIALPGTMVSGVRIPTSVRIVSVVAIQRGSESVVASALPGGGFTPLQGH